MPRTRSIASLCIAVLVLSAGAQATKRPPPTYAEQVNSFLSGSDSPVLLVGKIAWVERGYLPCTVMNLRTTEWTVTRVLYGFDPGKKIGVRFGSCGNVEAQYTSQDEMLVIARPGANGVWDGMRESVTQANDANVRAARKAMDDYLRHEIRRLTRPLRSGTERPILVFEGTILDPGPPVAFPCPHSVAPIFPVKFQIEQILRGTWSAKEVTVQFLGCGPPPNSPYRSGNRVLVLALPLNTDPTPPFRAGFMLPPSQRDQLLADLLAVAGKT
jgi:hypothetical protein